MVGGLHARVAVFGQHDASRDGIPNPCGLWGGHYLNSDFGASTAQQVDLGFISNQSRSEEDTGTEKLRRVLSCKTRGPVLSLGSSTRAAQHAELLLLPRTRPGR
jgi:hypothetical protein